MVVQKVDLVDVEDVPVRLCEDSGLELLLSGLEDVLEVECTGDAVLGGAKRQLDDGHGDLFGFQLLSPGQPLAALDAHPLGVSGVAVVGAAYHGQPRREDLGQRPDGRGFGGSFLSFYQNPSDTRVDDVQ